MGVQTGIEWCDATWNPWVGCTKVSEGCDNCYMFREQKRWGNDPTIIRQTKGAKRDLPIRKNRDGTWKISPGSFVFVCSWSDFFHEDVPAAWRNDAVRNMIQRPDLTFLLLTKRVDRMARWAKALQDEHAYDYSHIWFGATAENQARADKRIRELIEIDWPGKKFVSIEPQLGPVRLKRNLPRWLKPGVRIFSERIVGVQKIDWVICGGESGPGHRPFDLDWARSLRDQCVEAGVPFFLKQYSAIHPKHMPELDGQTWAQKP
ncbi:MAG: DUF5131 family protein [Candidatus Hydrogenedentes bacterium]|nr:DUF5131 family protein [Candidatus Hydrogenedentota bacterium]